MEGRLTELLGSILLHIPMKFRSKMSTTGISCKFWTDVIFMTAVVQKGIWHTTDTSKKVLVEIPFATN